MKILIINSVIGIGSTGKICLSLAENYAKEGHEVFVAYGRSGSSKNALIKKYGHRIGTKLDIGFHLIATRLFDNHGFASVTATKRFIKWIDNFKPDLIWMHNLHGYYLNIQVFFNYLKKHPEIQKKWTLHDCWPITGHCAYFEQEKCTKWKECCRQCPLKNDYPTSLLFDNSERNYLRKKEAFSNIQNMSLIVPSLWLKSIIEDSFLGEYPISVVYNQIDKTKYSYHPNKVKTILNIQDKTMILGVANIWERRKGFSEFLKLSTMLGNNFVIVIVGKTNNKHIKALKKSGFRMADNKGKFKIFKPINPAKNILFDYKPFESIGAVIEPNVYDAFLFITGMIYHYNDIKNFVYSVVLLNKTENVDELIDLYSAADVLFNPTFDENYPTVNLEAMSVGLKVITYDTGGCKETIDNFREESFYEQKNDSIIGK